MDEAKDVSGLTMTGGKEADCRAVQEIQRLPEDVVCDEWRELRDIGWRGEPVPDTVKGWGRGVVSLQVDKWRAEGQGRWRDREVVESFWKRVEEAMRRSGWSSGGPNVK